MSRHVCAASQSLFRGGKNFGGGEEPTNIISYIRLKHDMIGCFTSTDKY